MAKRKRTQEQNRAHNLKTRYGITIEDYNQLLRNQGGVCAICGGVEEARKLRIDHIKNTKIIRGLLCDNCNKGLGMFGDSAELLLQAVAYLHHHK